MSCSWASGGWNRLHGRFIMHYLVTSLSLLVPRSNRPNQLIAFNFKGLTHLVSWMVKLTGTLGSHSEAWRTVPSNSSVLIFASTHLLARPVGPEESRCLTRRTRFQQATRSWLTRTSWRSSQMHNWWWLNCHFLGWSLGWWDTVNKIPQYFLLCKK